MRFSKSFIVIACTLLLLVGAAFGYSVKMLQEVRDIDHELNLVDYDLRALEYRIFVLETQQLTMEPPGKGDI